jgi:hypothetical protein
VKDPAWSVPELLADLVAPEGAFGGVTLTVSVVEAVASVQMPAPLKNAWIVSVPPGAFVAVHDAVPELIVASHNAVVPVEKSTSGEELLGLGPGDAVTCIVYVTWSPYVTDCGLTLAVAVVLIAAPAGVEPIETAPAVATVAAAAITANRRTPRRLLNLSSM